MQWRDAVAETIGELTRNASHKKYLVWHNKFHRDKPDPNCWHCTSGLKKWEKITVTFNKFEIAIREQAEKTLADANSTIGERNFAKTVMSQTLEKAQARLMRNKAKRLLGPKPTDPVALAAWRDALKKMKCEAILDDSASSLAATRMAERTLEEIDRRDRQRGPVTRLPNRGPGRPKEKEVVTPIVSTPAEETYSSPAAQRFLEGLMGEESSVQEIEPDLPEVKAVTEKPIETAQKAEEKYCPVHICPITRCGCDSGEICPQCLVPKGRCYCPKNK